MPNSLPDVLALLRRRAGEAKLLAGGQSLGPLLNLRLVRPQLLIDLNRVEGLSYIREGGSHVSIGAMTRQREAEFSDVLRRNFPIIGEAMTKLGHPAIRNRGTIGGSLVHADPVAELPCVMALLNAVLIVEGPRGRRVLSTDEFFLDPYTTELAEDEILTEIRIPLLPPGTRWSFLEFSRRHGDFALAEAGVLLFTGSDRPPAHRIVVGTPNSPPLRLLATAREIAEAPSVDDGDGQAREFLLHLEEAASREIGALAGESQLTAYEQHLAAVLVRRALAQALGSGRSS